MIEFCKNLLLLIVTIIFLIIIYKLIENYLRTFYINDIDKKYVLITGCDSGFGHKLAQQLDGKGVFVIATCLTEDGKKNLENKCSSRFQAIQLDVTAKDQIDNLKKKLERELSDCGLHALVNNAGIGTNGIIGVIENYDKEDFAEVLNVNTLAVIDLSLKLLPLLVKAKGRIVNMTSAAGKGYSPINIPYFVSKHATENFSDCLRSYLKLYKKNVSVHIIEPGFYKTDILSDKNTKNAIENSLLRYSPERRKQIKKKFTEHHMKGLKILQKNASTKLEDVTNAYENAIFSKWPKKRYPVGIDCCYFFLPFFSLPNCITDAVISVLQSSSAFHE